MLKLVPLRNVVGQFHSTIDDTIQHEEVMAKVLLNSTLSSILSTITDDDTTIFSFVEIGRLGSFKETFDL